LLRNGQALGKFRATPHPNGAGLIFGWQFKSINRSHPDTDWRRAKVSVQAGIGKSWQFSPAKRHIISP
jgi:hypothetical protein